MITVLFGQPCSGKTTLAKELENALCSLQQNNSIIIDGDQIRTLFKNNNYGLLGRATNHQNAINIAIFNHSIGSDVIISMMFPYITFREELIKQAELIDAPLHFFYLHYDKQNERRGREQYHLEDFETPAKKELNSGLFTELNTGELSTQDCIKKILHVIL